MNTKSADMSGFSAASDMEFLNFEANEDSFDLSVSASGDFQNDNSGLLSSKASQASRDSSDWSPSAYSDSNSNTDFDDSSDILADIHLPSLGETGTARKILSQLMNESSPQRLKHLPKHYVTHAAEGYVALQHMNDDIRETREQSAALVEELTQLKKQQMATRDELQDLDIGENLFHQLSKLAPSEMTLREFASLRAASLYMPLRQQVQGLERCLHEVQVQLELSSGTVESQSSELARQRKQLKTLQESYRLDLMAAEERGDRLNTRLEVEIVKRQEREAQAARCDEALADAEAMRKEAAILRTTVDEQSRLLATLTSNDRNHSDLLADMTRAKDMLAMDKAYLQRELGEVTASAHEQSRKVDSQQMHIDKLDAKILELTNQLVTVQMTTRSAFDERMEKEVNRLRQDYEKDMTSMQDSSKELSSHENRILREIRQNLERDLDITRRKLDDRESEVSSLTKELSVVRAASESELSMLRAEIKMKHFEVTSLGATFEERSSQLKLAQLDLDVLREEVSVHKTALMRMENECASRTGKLEDDLSRAYETIHAYDVLFSDDSGPGGGGEAMDLHLKEQFRSREPGVAHSLGSDGGDNDDDGDNGDSDGGGDRDGDGARRRSGSNDEDLYHDDDFENDDDGDAGASSAAGATGATGAGGSARKDATKHSSGGRRHSKSGGAALSSSSAGGGAGGGNKFISSQGASALLGSAGGRSSGSYKHSLSVLISNPRKFRQLLDSSERNIRTIQQLSQRIRELEAQNTRLLKDKKKLNEEIDKNIRELNLVPMSSKHVIDLYSQKDQECRHLLTKLKSHEDDARGYRRTIEDAVKQNASLREKLKGILAERKELTELKEMLLELQQQTGDGTTVPTGMLSGGRGRMMVDCTTSTAGDIAYDGNDEEEEGGHVGSEFIARLTSADHSFTADSVQAPVYRDAALNVNVDEMEIRGGAGSPNRTHNQHSPRHSPRHHHQHQHQSPSPSSSATPQSGRKLQELGVSPSLLRAMVERNPSNSPARSVSSSPGQKIGFHVRSPAGK